MTKTSSPPSFETPGPRNPVIRTWHSDTETSTAPSGDYLTTFESAMTRAFVAAFHQAAKRGQA